MILRQQSVDRGRDPQAPSFRFVPPAIHELSRKRVIKGAGRARGVYRLPALPASSGALIRTDAADSLSR